MNERNENENEEDDDGDDDDDDGEEDDDDEFVDDDESWQTVSEGNSPVPPLEGDSHELPSEDNSHIPIDGGSLLSEDSGVTPVGDSYSLGNPTISQEGDSRETTEELRNPPTSSSQGDSLTLQPSQGNDSSTSHEQSGNPYSTDRSV